MFWILLLLTVTLLAAAGIYYLYRRVIKYEKISALGRKGKLIAIFAPVLLFLLLLLIFGALNAMIILLHLVAAMALCSLIGLLPKKKNHIAEDITAVCLTVVYLCFGWFFAHHIYMTEYAFKTEKDVGDGLRIVQIADSHLGMTIDQEKFASLIDEIQNTNPDIVVITGDFVDDDSTKADMISACEALGSLKTTYGVYFAFGNHDKGYYDSRDFTVQELYENLSENGIVVLEDESVLIDNKFYIIGRKDRSYTQRESISSLTYDLDMLKYTIVLDHQPNDYRNEAIDEVDLVLSGHTHGGHIFPAGIIGVLMGSNDMAYGTEHRNKTDFVVTSGVSGWGIPFKTGAISEYVVIDIS